jgi:hypothetical protein
LNKWRRTFDYSFQELRSRQEKEEGRRRKREEKRQERK